MFVRVLDLLYSRRKMTTGNLRGSDETSEAGSYRLTSKRLSHCVRFARSPMSVPVIALPHTSQNTGLTAILQSGHRAEWTSEANLGNIVKNKHFA